MNLDKKIKQNNSKVVYLYYIGIYTRKKLKKIVVIGSGFSGLASATELASAGHDVIILEKNNTPGGRARQFKADGFTFDMGPSWYWMPEVFEQYFEKHGKSVSDYYNLKRLDPSYTVCFGKDDFVDIPASFSELLDLFESLEKGAAPKLESFLEEAAYKYKVGMEEYVWKPSLSVTEFFDVKVIKSAFKLQMFSSISKQIRSLFSNPKIIELLEFPVLFLGATPQDTPALYSLMNYADLKLGTWYPEGGMYKIIEGMVSLAEDKGVKFLYNHEVKSINISGRHVQSVDTVNSSIDCDYVVASADYHHIEQQVIAPEYRLYDAKYWDKRKMAPSSLLFYIGLNKKLDNLNHHTLFFDTDFNLHAKEIYKDPKWPTSPLFYMCTPSVTDNQISPEGHENLFLLMPLAPGIEDTDVLREEYFELLVSRVQDLCGINIKQNIVYKRSYCIEDFKNDYNAFKGNAYGLANTLDQTAILKPTMKNKKISNLYFTGQLTVPGPGVPPSIISGQMVANEVIKNIARHGK